MEYPFEPFPCLISNRLQLRSLTTADTTQVFALRSDPTVAKYLDRPLLAEPSEAESYISHMQEGVRKRKWMIWGIHYLEQGFAGSICLWNFSQEVDTAEIGYELRPQFMGKGIMTEAIPLVLEFGFDRMRLQHIEAEVNAQNLASIRLLERSGFVQKPIVNDDGSRCFVLSSSPNPF